MEKLSFYFTQRLLMTLECFMFFIQGYFGKLKVNERKGAKFVSSLNFSHGESLNVLA